MDEMIEGKTDPVQSIISAMDLSIKSKILRNPDLGQTVVTSCLWSKMTDEEKDKYEEIFTEHEGKPDRIFTELIKLNTEILDRVGLWFQVPEQDISVIFIDKIKTIKYIVAQQMISKLEKEHKITMEGEEDFRKSRIHVIRR